MTDEDVIAQAEAALTQPCDDPHCRNTAQVFVRLHDCQHTGRTVRIVCLPCSYQMLAGLSVKVIHAQAALKCMVCPWCATHFHEVSDFIVDRGAL